MSHYESQMEAHYKQGIEPVAYIESNSLDFFEGNAIKYITRWRRKGGVEDLRKARRYIDMLIEQENNKLLCLKSGT